MRSGAVPLGVGRAPEVHGDLITHRRRPGTDAEHRRAGRVPGRPRDRCRNLAYEERLEERYEREPVEPPPPVPGSILDQWVTEGAKFDDIVQDPYLPGRFMDDLMCRISVDHILENDAYQHGVNQLIVIFFMIGRMSNGTYQLPIVV
ncbi:MAG TPA: hypothetical protein VFI30_04085 [Nocardioidaceae bacterium]|nr:hypothetical protein [Nocardioidaceae bacterium]